MHHLSFIILKILVKGEKSGYDLMKEIESLTGWKPSSGSVYPMLDNLLKKKLVTVKKKDRRKLYSLTSKGRSFIKEIDKKKITLITEMQERIKIMSSLCDIPKSNQVIEMLEMHKKDKLPFEDLTKETMELQDIFFAMLKSPNFKRNKEKIRRVLKKTISELKKLK